MWDTECGKKAKRLQSKRQALVLPFLITAVALVALCVVVGRPLYQNFSKLTSSKNAYLAGGEDAESRNRRSDTPSTSQRHHRHHHHHQRSYINESSMFKEFHFMNRSLPLLNNNINNSSSTKIKIDIPPSAEDYPYKLARLPSDLIPSHYILDLDIDLKKDNFTGTVTILLDCEGPTDKVIFHGRNLYLLRIQMEDGNSKPVHYKNIAFLKNHDMYVLTLNQTLDEDSDLRMFIQYTARFSKILGGLYKSSYTDFGVQK